MTNADGLAAVRGALTRHDWQAAFDAAATASGVTPGEEAERLDLVADAAWWLGRLDDCIAAREQAYRAYDDLGDDRRAGQCAVWLFEHHAMSARPAVAGAWLRRARRALEDDPECVAHGSLLLREAESAHGAGELDVATAAASRVAELGRRLRSPDLEAEALQTVGRILIDRGELVDGMGHLDEAMLFAVEGRLGPYSTGKVYCSLISACEDVGDYDRAAEWTDATMRWAQQHPFAIFPGICRVHRAIVLKRRGSLAEAEQEAVRAGEELIGSHVANSAAAYAELGDIRRRLGELDPAEDAFERARALCGRPCAELALLRLAQGRNDSARSIITECLRDTSTSRLGRARLLPIQVHVAVAVGDLPTAATGLAELDEIADAFPTPVLRATATATRGRLELAQNAPVATATLQQAVEGWEALDVPYEVATTCTLLGQALRDRGDDAGATASFSTAVELFEQIGAHLDARLVLHDSRPSLPAGLTAREVEVLRLIATGMTNNEVAAELHLSVKTVSRHLSNIFTKIGVNSRSAATAFAFEHQLVEPHPS